VDTLRSKLLDNLNSSVMPARAHSYNRRTFLSATSGAAVALATGTRQSHAQPCAAMLRSPHLAPNAFFPERVAPTTLRTLALTAIDAAVRAGARYADVRIAEQQHLIIVKQLGLNFATFLGTRLSYGVRALVDGTWSFKHGTVPDTETIVDVARGAVARAKTLNAAAPGRVTLAAAPVVTGEWSTPVVIDPFDVSLDEQMALLGAWDDVARRAPSAAGFLLRLDWQRETRVVATSEGTCVTQHLARAFPVAQVAADRARGPYLVGVNTACMTAASGGYETVAGAGIQEEIARTADDAARYALLPQRAIDVGRYPLAMDGAAVAMMAYETLGQAIEMDRVLGEEADASGTSFLAPVSTFLGTPVISPLLTVTTDRTPPSVTGVKWDDEGVEAVPATVIRDGCMVDYQTSRQHMTELQSWYQGERRPLASSGRAVATNPDSPVQVRCGHLAIAPSKTTASLDDLIKDMERGILVRQGIMRGIATDHRLSSVNMSSFEALILEVERGKVVRRALASALQFGTVAMWKSLSALGDATTVLTASGRTEKGMPWWSSPYDATAPAALFKEANLIDIGRHS
jgi:TldD protein